MRKIVCFLMMMTMLLSVALAGQAEKRLAEPHWAFDATIDAMVLVEDAELARAACDHVYRIYGKPYKTEYVMIDGSNHEKRIYYDTFCDKCGERAIAFQSGGLESHTMVANGDAHESEEGLHTYHQRCSKCTHTSSYTVGCPGTGNGDCPLPYSKVEVAPSSAE